MTDSAASQTLVIERRLPAPRDRVWRAWTQPALFVQWLGPHDWPAVTVEADVRPSGRWRAVLRSASGDELVQGGRYLEVDAPSRLRFTFRWESDNHEDGPGVETEVSVSLEEEGPAATRMIFTQRGLANADSARGHEGGWQQTFDRLVDWLDGKNL